MTIEDVNNLRKKVFPGNFILASAKAASVDVIIIRATLHTVINKLLRKAEQKFACSQAFEYIEKSKFCGKFNGF